jgi:GT2 family glycosyltransferase
VRTLVGIPVFRVPDLVRRCLASIIGTPADIVVIDNASDSDVKQVLRGFKNKCKVITNDRNLYCNGAWNQILSEGIAGGYECIGIGSSDVEMHSGWYETLTKRLDNYSKEVLIPRVGSLVPNPDYMAGEVVTGGVAGYFTFLPREAAELVYPIPQQLRHWHGDEYIFGKLRSLGWKVVIMRDVTAWHEQSAITAVTPDAYKVIEQDIVSWEAYKETQK